MNLKTPSATTLLTTLALVKANAERGHTHLDNFAPFALEAMRVQPEKWHRPHDVATRASEQLGLHLPTQVADAILRRLARQKWVSREKRTYRLVPEKVADLPNLQADQSKFLRQQSALVEAFVAFVKVQHDVDLQPDAAAEALYAQIEHDTVDLLKVEVRGSTYERRESARHKYSYLVADFITEAVRADQASYEAILSAAKGSMLVAAIQVPNLEQVESRFNNTTLFLDAPLLLQIVGLEGPEARDSVGEVVRLAVVSGAKVAAFEHSVSEAEGVIVGNIEARKRGNRVPGRANGIEAYAIKANLDANDLDMQYGKFRSNLRSLGIELLEKPDPDPKIEIDELALHDALDAAVGGYRTMEAKLKDVDSLRGVHFLRRGSAPRSIENCRAVLITDNDAVARVAREFFRPEGHAWPVATNISDLATILYLKVPQEASKLPELRLIADAYTALEPGLQVWTKFLETIERQSHQNAVSATDIALLCHTQESRRALMDTTFGRADRVTDQTVATVLEMAKAQVAAPAIRDSRLARAEAEKSSAERDAATAASSDAATRAAALEQRVASEEAARLLSETKARGIESSLSGAAAKKAKKRVRVALSVIVLLLIAGGGASLLGWSPAGWLGTAQTIVGGIAAVALLGFAVLRNVFGGHLEAWLAPAERAIAGRTEDRMRREAGLEPRSLTLT